MCFKKAKKLFYDKFAVKLKIFLWIELKVKIILILVLNFSLSFTIQEKMNFKLIIFVALGSCAASLQQIHPNTLSKYLFLPTKISTNNVYVPHKNYLGNHFRNEREKVGKFLK